MNDPSLIESPCDLPMQYTIPNEQVFWRWEMSREYLQEFAKINLANLVIWQLAKIYAKVKKKAISKSLPFRLGKNKKQAHKNYRSTNASFLPSPFLPSHAVGRAVVPSPDQEPQTPTRRWPSSTPAGHLLHLHRVECPTSTSTQINFEKIIRYHINRIK